MFSWYLVLKFIHIASAITAVGANITYGMWNARIAADPTHTSFVLKGIKFLATSPRLRGRRRSER